MRIVLEALPVGHAVCVEYFCFTRAIPIGALIKARIVTELVPLGYSDCGKPLCSVQSVERPIRDNIIRFDSDDFKARVFCLAWEHEPDKWRYAWFSLDHPREDIYLAYPLKALRSQVHGLNKSFVVFEPQKG